MSEKSKDLCSGCRDEYYNGQGEKECWNYADAQVVTRYRIGWWTAPTQPFAYSRVETLNCHSAPGKYALHKNLPDFVKPEEVS